MSDNMLNTLFFVPGNIFFLTVFFVLTWNVSCKSDCDYYISVVRHIEGVGFHRLLNVSVVFKIPREASTKLFYNDCEIAIHQLLPAGAYVDPEQLNELSNSYKPINTFYLDDKVDVEAIEEISSPLNVFAYHNKLEESVHNDVTLKNVISSIDYYHLLYTFKVPFHLRYHRPQYGGGYRDIKISPLTLLGRCSGSTKVESQMENVISQMMSPVCAKDFPFRLPCSSVLTHEAQQKFCEDWKSFFYNDEMNMISGNISEEEQQLLTVPVGDLDHLWFVQIITLVVTNSAAIYITYCILSTVSYE